MNHIQAIKTRDTQSENELINVSSALSHAEPVSVMTAFPELFLMNTMLISLASA